MDSNDKRKLIHKKDIIIVAVILIVAITGFYAANSYRDNDVGSDGTSEPQSTRAYAFIYYKGVGVSAFYLDQDMVFDLEDNPEVIFEIKDGSIAFTHSDCPDQLCVDMGWQSKPGDFAACLPNQTLLFIDSEPVDK